MAKANVSKVEIPDLEIKEIQIEIQGTSSLIVHQFGEKARKQILDIQNKKAKTARPERVPEEEYDATLYKFKDGKTTGFPAVGFKAAMVRGAKSLGLNMTDVRGALFVKADEGDLVEILGDHVMRTDMVRVGNGGSDIRYRAEYPVWCATLSIIYNAGVFSAEQIATICRIGGFAAGIGEWRPEKSATGSFGTWDLVTSN